MPEQKSMKRWLALTAAGLGEFMALIDVTVVNVALPTMQRSFGESFNQLQWVLNAYTLAFAVTLLIVSKLGDMFGLKRMFVISLIIFTAASFLNGIAPNLVFLDLSRALQAIGGAGVSSLSMALVATNFTGKERGLAIGILSSVIGLSVAAGPLVGGYLVEYFNWPAIFFVNVPLGIIAVILTLTTVKELPHDGQNDKIDFVGMLLSAGGLFALIYGLIQKETNPDLAWLSWQVGGWLALAVGLLVAFVIVETHLAQPMMDMRMLTDLGFLGSVLAAFGLGAGVFAFNVYLTSLMQNYMGYSALGTGLRQLSMSVWSLFLGPFIGILGNRFSKKWIATGALLLLAIAQLVFNQAISPTATFISILPALILMGIGNATINPTLNAAALEGISQQQMGMASGIVNVFRQFGVTFGVVVIGLSQTKVYEAHITKSFNGLHLPAQMADGLHKALLEAGPFSGHAIAFSHRVNATPFAKSIQTAVINAYDHGLTAASYTAMVLILIGAAAAMFLMRSKPSN
ncbi:MFS transporter [Levilactobacillus bambusae]|uniref:MFS transporter n=1 Tax=Levilactobacillus bambusae TaxID=2024736 RepID=A0A2V1MXY9_9LACO|nr:MFS transporter [Levilactobacillus bambusae]PWF99652.1 MFS transporter [Levilactobacillus bambusae]